MQPSNMHKNIVTSSPELDNLTFYCYDQTMSTTVPDNRLKLPETFSFSQSSLQAFEDCPRRFWLAYAAQLPWPAVEAAPIQDFEALMRLGSLFHRLVERAETGIDLAQVTQGIEPPLDTWFQAYQQHRPADLPTEYIEIERVLSIPFSTEGKKYRLGAKYDLIAADYDGTVAIVDWKTNRKRTDPAALHRRLQSLVYPYVLVEASATLPFGPIQPEQIEMIYWFVNAPLQPVRFRYDSAQHAANRDFLHNLLAQILAGHSEADFAKVLDTEANRKRFCSYCVYRSRCNRGVAAGDLDALADAEDFFAVDVESALEFTLDDVTELAF